MIFTDILNHYTEESLIPAIKIAPIGRKKKVNTKKYKNDDIINFIKMILPSENFKQSCMQIYNITNYTDNKGNKQQALRLLCWFNRDNMEEVLHSVYFSQTNSYYITKNGFYADKRTKQNGETALYTLENIAIDIDNHSSNDVKYINREVDRLLYFLRNDYSGEIIPNFHAVRSGRGVHLWITLDSMHQKMKWLYDIAVKKICDVIQDVIDRWNIDLEIDLNASKNASGIIRLPFTYNQKTKKRTKATLEKGLEYEYTTDDLKEYFDIKDIKTENKKEVKKTEKKSKKIFISSNTDKNYKALNIKRMMFIEKIVDRCNGDVTGRRDNLLWLYYNYVLAITQEQDKAVSKVLELNSKFKEPQSKSEVLHEIKSVDKVGYYKITNDDFLDKLSATVDERILYTSCSNRELEREKKRSEKEQRNLMIIELHQQGYKAKDIAEKLNISLRTVKNKIGEIAKTEKHNRNNIIITLRKQGKSLKAISKETGVSYNTVKKVLTQSEDDIGKQEKSLKVIAKETGVSYNTVEKVVILLKDEDNNSFSINSA